MSTRNGARSDASKDGGAGVGSGRSKCAANPVVKLDSTDSSRRTALRTKLRFGTDALEYELTDSSVATTDGDSFGSAIGADAAGADCNVGWFSRGAAGRR